MAIFPTAYIMIYFITLDIYMLGWHSYDLFIIVPIQKSTGSGFSSFPTFLLWKSGEWTYWFSLTFFTFEIILLVGITNYCIFCANL